MKNKKLLKAFRVKSRVQCGGMETEKPQHLKCLSLRHSTATKPQHDQSVTTQELSMERDQRMSEHTPTKTGKNNNIHLIEEMALTKS